MELLFFIIIIFQLFINIFIYKNILNPTVMLRITWAFSGFLLLLFKNIWGVSLSLETILIFLTGFIFFDLGYLFFHIYLLKCKKNKTNKSKKIYTISIKKSFLLVFLMITYFIFIYYYSKKLVDLHSIKVVQNNFLTKLRYLMKYTDVNTSYIQLSLPIIEIIGIVYVIFYIRERNIFIRKKLFI